MADLSSVTLFLLVLVTAASALARVIGVPYPILLVIGGSLVGFVPGMPQVHVDPDLVLLVLLPPLLYNAATRTSMRDLRTHARVITVNAVGLVVATTCLVAVAIHAVVPDMDWAVAFALGAIVSPTDPLAASQIARRLDVPRRNITVLEGESLVNDGSALALYQSAVAAVGVASFEIWRAGGLFVLEVVGGVAIGLVVAFVIDWLLARVGGDQMLGLLLSLLAGYLAYLPAQELHVSGVLAVVACGLVMGRREAVLGTANSRLHNAPFWEILVFLLNAVLFASVGLELPSVLADQDRSTGLLIGTGLLVSATVIATRLVWPHLATVVIRTLDRRPKQRDLRSTWRTRIVSSWCGLRGAVSLAAALALPAGFPERDLLVFLALCVIWATLVGQGLTLPLVIKALRVEDDGQAAHEELHARKAATKAALDELDRISDEPWVRDDSLERMRGQYGFRRRRLMQRAGKPEDDEDAESRSQDFQRLVHTVISAQRDELVRLRDLGEIGDEALRIVERELDLEEERLDL